MWSFINSLPYLTLMRWTFILACCVVSFTLKQKVCNPHPSVDRNTWTLSVLLNFETIWNWNLEIKFKLSRHVIWSQIPKHVNIWNIPVIHSCISNVGSGHSCTVNWAWVQYSWLLPSFCVHMYLEMACKPRTTCCSLIG